VAQAHPEIARKGVLLRKFGQEVIRITAGKRVHGTGAVPGGVNKLADRRAERDSLQVADQMIWPGRRTRCDMAKPCCHAQNPALYNRFGSFRSNLLSLVRPDGAMDLYDGVLRARDADGQILFDGVERPGLLELIAKKSSPGAT
jgi:NAD-reducing hydrogenase large subunit